MFTSINGLSIHYELAGKGAPVLILHGWGASVEAMRCVMEAVSALGMQAVALDFPGFGKSEEPKEAWGVPEYAALTYAFMEQQGLIGADVICHSFGGRVVIQLASERPAAFSRLVLIGAAGIRPKRTLKWYVRTYAYKLGKRLAGIAWFDKVFHLQQKQLKAGSEDYKALKSDVMRGTFVKTVNLDLTSRLPHIQNETLLLWGALDTASPLYMGKAMEAAIPNAGLAVFEGAGHFCYAEQYPRFCAVLRAFLKPSEI